jgi:hypothetical protein
MTGDLRSYDIAKAAAISLINICKRGLLDKDAIYKAMQALADQLGEAGESSAQKFNRAFGSGDRNRCPAGDALLREFNKLSNTGTLPFHWTPQFGDETPEASVRRVTVRSDDRVRTNMDHIPYETGPEPQVVDPGVADLCSARGTTRSLKK